MFFGIVVYVDGFSSSAWVCLLMFAGVFVVFVACLVVGLLIAVVTCFRVGFECCLQCLSVCCFCFMLCCC